MVYEFYPHLPTCYEDYEDVCLPKHESIREKTRREGVYGYHYHWNKDAYTWIDRFLEDSVGKKFDNIYSKVCERFRKKKDFKFRKKFKSRIDPRNIPDIYWHSNNYYLDSNHIIRRYAPIKNSKRRKYVMELDRSEDYYIVNKKKLFFEYPEIVPYLKAKLGKDIEYIIVSSERLSNDLGKKVEKCIKDKPLLIIDDLCDGGGTFCGVAKAFEKIGVSKDRLNISVIHMVNAKGIENLSKHFNHVWFTNSYKDWNNLPDNVTLINLI